MQKQMNQNILPQADLCTLDLSTLLLDIDKSIKQLEVNYLKITTHLKYLYNTNYEYKDIETVLHNISSRILPDITFSELIECMCIVYLKSIKFNLPCYILKNKINEKHNFIILNKKCSLEFNSNNFAITNLPHNIENSKFFILVQEYVDSIALEVGIQNIRLYCVYSMISRVCNQKYDIYYVISYIINYDSSILIQWIKNKPLPSTWDMLEIPYTHNFVFNELKYTKTLKILKDINTIEYTYKFIEFLIKKLGYTQNLYNLVISSFLNSKDTKTMFNLLDYIQNTHKESFYILLYQVMKQDKSILNNYFIQRYVQMSISDIIHLINVNNKLLKYLNTTTLLKISQHKDFQKLIFKYKNFKLFYKMVFRHKIFNSDTILNCNIILKLKFCLDIRSLKKLLFLFRKFPIETNQFFNLVCNLLKQGVKEYSKRKLNHITCIKNNNTTKSNIKFTKCKHNSNIRKLIIKLFFIFNNPNTPINLIRNIFLLNRKFFMKCLIKYSDYSTLIINIVKVIPYSFKINITDYWSLLINYKIKRNARKYCRKCANKVSEDFKQDLSLKLEKLPNGLYFHSSYIKYPTTTSFTLNLSFIRLQQIDSHLVDLIEHSESISEIFSVRIFSNQICFEKKEGEVVYKKVINLLSDTLYLEIKYNKHEISILYNDSVYMYNMKSINTVRVGYQFKGMLCYMVYYESVNFPESKLINLAGYDLYIKGIRKLELWCHRHRISGMYIDSHVPYMLYKKIPVEYYNILENFL